MYNLASALSSKFRYLTDRTKQGFNDFKLLKSTQNLVTQRARTNCDNTGNANGVSLLDMENLKSSITQEFKFGSLVLHVKH